MDYDYTNFLDESMLICRETNGGFTLGDIKNLDFDEHNHILEEALRLQKERLKNG